MIALRCIAAYMLTEDHDYVCPIPEHDLWEMVNKLEQDTKYRLGLVVWHYDANPVPVCTREMIEGVSRICKEDIKTIWERSKYSWKEGDRFMTPEELTTALEHDQAS